MEQIKNQVEAIKTEYLKGNLLLKKSSSPEWSRYKCDTCKDFGFVHPLQYGKVVYDKVIPCPLCGPPATGMVFNIGDSENQMLLDNFNHSLPGVADAFRAASDMAVGKADFIWLVLTGDPGVGKTHLAKGVGVEMINRGKFVKYYYIPTLLAEMRKGMDIDKYPGAVPIELIVDEACLCHLLILDDLGAENFTAWAGARIEEILNRRYEANKGLLVTTNKDIRKLPAPILSRFKDVSKCRIVLNAGADWRKNKAREGI